MLREIHEGLPEPLKIGGLLSLFGVVTLAQVNLIVQISVGTVTFFYIGSKLYRIWRPRKDDSGQA